MANQAASSDQKIAAIEEELIDNTTMGNISQSELSSTEDATIVIDDDDVVQPKPKQVFKLRAMSFNIRVDSVLDGKHSWKHRKELVEGVIRNENADIIGIQEALVHQVSELESSLSTEGYGCVVGPGEFFDENSGNFIGEHVPIFYNKSRLELVDKGFFWFSPEPTLPGSKGWDAITAKACNWAQFQTISDVKSQLFVFNTHWDQGVAARRNSSYILREYIENYTVKYDDETNKTSQVNTIVLGDFNCSTKANCYSILTRGVDIGAAVSDEDSEGGSDDDEDEVFKLQNVVDVYSNLSDNKSDLKLAPTFTGFKNGCPRTGPRKGEPVTIDYILVSSQIRVENVRVLEEETEQKASTHRPVIADLLV